MVRALRDDGVAYLGPFRSKRAADLVMTAIWDAHPIRRCRTRPGSREGKCAAAQMGIARCPCDGQMSEDDYRQVVDQLLTGIAESPHLLLDPLVDRMTRFANDRRFEEAAWLRDRHDALARAIERRHRWQALTGVGFFEVEDGNGCRTVIDHGSFVESRGNW